MTESNQFNYEDVHLPDDIDFHPYCPISESQLIEKGLDPSNFPRTLDDDLQIQRLIPVSIYNDLFKNQ